MRDKAILAWMRAHVHEHVDECGLADYTGLVEAWDRECSTGDATLDCNHVAWCMAILAFEDCNID